MLKKMRWRFIGAAMAAFSAVILVLLCIINVWNYVNITHQQDDTLNQLLGFETRPRPPVPNEKLPYPGSFTHQSPEVQYMIRFFVVYTNEEGAITRINQDHIASVSEDEAIEYTAQILKRGKNYGYFRNYRYITTQINTGNISIFLYSERELMTVKSLLYTTSAVAVFSLIAVFALVVAFSKRAIAPYIRNIETQKQFITDAGHELKTPLTAISTSADVLSMENESNEWIQNIQLQSRRMSKLIADLITLSRLDEEQPFPNMTEFSLSEAIWEITEPFSSLAQANEKDYIQHIEENLSILGDRNSIQQMISILLDNALKYSSDNGTIKLDVNKASGKFEIKVSNTCNIKTFDSTKHLFDRFYRAESSRSNRDSYGLGLSIAKSIAEKHGGSIHVEAVGNTAICFIVTL